MKPVELFHPWQGKIDEIDTSFIRDKFHRFQFFWWTSVTTILTSEFFWYRERSQDRCHRCSSKNFWIDLGLFNCHPRLWLPLRGTGIVSIYNRMKPKKIGFIVSVVTDFHSNLHTRKSMIYKWLEFTCILSSRSRRRIDKTEFFYAIERSGHYYVIHAWTLGVWPVHPASQKRNVER